jgi:hypothetical protein
MTTLAHARYFAKEHFEAHKGQAPAYLTELVVHCLELVAQLAHRKLEFRFKGGNSQLVLLEKPRRLSIDVDIVTTVGKPELTALVETITTECSAFTRVETRAPKTKPWLPMISFKLFFNSHYQPAEEAYVMLDAVLEAAPYDGVRKQVRCGELYESSETVELPTVSGLIADKMLCIGPATTGIPLGKNKEAQRLKHVFDIGTLSRHPTDADAMRRALHACLAQENKLQNSAWTWAQVAEDTATFLAAARAHATQPALDGIEKGTYLWEIVHGFDGFRKHVWRDEYTWQHFIDDCTRAHELAEQLGRTE